MEGKVNNSPFILSMLGQTSTDILVPVAPNLAEDQLNVTFCSAYDALNADDVIVISPMNTRT